MFAQISVYWRPVVRTRLWYGKEKRWLFGQMYKVGPIYVFRSFKEGRDK